MSETRAFPTPVLVSLTSGILLCNSFGDIHEAAEFLMGHPIWTHEFASKEFWQSMRAKLLAQHPDLDIDAKSVTKENWKERGADFLATLIATVGAERTITRGNGQRTADPITTLREIVGDRTIIAAVVGDEK